MYISIQSEAEPKETEFSHIENLMHAVLVLAIQDFTRLSVIGSSSYGFNNAKDWFEEERRFNGYPFTFLNICDYFDLNAQDIKEKLYDAKRKNIKLLSNTKKAVGRYNKNK